ncbi:MAG: hypothetical protein F4Y03_16690 [Alphaproteobacteria bacterium]|nr:hypothetical protein [Alphaproteobacteria bacterium]
MGSGILAIWMDCAAEGEADFNEWYHREHFPERVGVPGFLKGVRYRAVEADRGYFTWYRTEEVGVLASKAYRDRLNDPTEWTERVMHVFRNTIRSAMTVEGEAGEASVGAWAAVLRADEELGAVDLEALAGAEGALSAMRWHLDMAATGSPTAEASIRGPDTQAARAVLVQASTEGAARRAAEALAGQGEVGVYALMAVLASEDLGG